MRPHQRDEAQVRGCAVRSAPRAIAASVRPQPTPTVIGPRHARSAPASRPPRWPTARAPRRRRRPPGIGATCTSVRPKRAASRSASASVRGGLMLELTRTRPWSRASASRRSTLKRDMPKPAADLFLVHLADMVEPGRLADSRSSLSSPRRTGVIGAGALGALGARWRAGRSHSRLTGGVVNDYHNCAAAAQILQSQHCRRRNRSGVGMAYVIGIDGGTESLRAHVFDLSGRSRGVGKCAYATAFPEPGHAEQNPEDWWHAAGVAVREALAAAGDRPGPDHRAGCRHHLLHRGGAGCRGALAAALRSCGWTCARTARPTRLRPAAIPPCGVNGGGAGPVSPGMDDPQGALDGAPPARHLGGGRDGRRVSGLT